MKCIALTAVAMAFSLQLIAGEPDVVLTIDSEQIEATPNTHPKLLQEARTRKQSGTSGYGELYRRAAWAALDEVASDPSIALNILNELKLQPETVFDQWDAYRIEGRAHMRSSAAANAVTSYSLAEQIASSDPSLIESHPLVFVEIMQQQSVAYAATEDFEQAALAEARLRDHASSRIQQDHKRAAAQVVCMYWLSAGNRDEYDLAFHEYKDLFPGDFDGNEGISRYREYARNLASLGDDLVQVLERLFGMEHFHATDGAIEIGEDLAWAWIQKENVPEAVTNAYSVMQQTWGMILANEADWLESAGPLPPDRAPIMRRIKSFMDWHAAMAYERNDLQTLNSLGHAYGERFGFEDGNAMNWIDLSEQP